MRRGSASRAAVALACVAAHAQVLAAGGHHAVDDASVLAPGACEVETWLERSGAPARLLHAGAACRLGPIELGIASEHERPRGGSRTLHQLQVKWATELSAAWSVGVSATPGWQADAQPRYQGSAVVALLTWQASDAIAVHANAGRDLVRSGPDQGRSGVGIDWSFHPQWKLMAERYRQDGGHLARAGLRWTPAKDWTVDVSRAIRRRGTGDASWTVGLTREFER